MLGSVSGREDRMGAQRKGGEPTRSGEPVTLQVRLQQAEQSLRELEERYALATSAALEGIYERDLEAGRLLLTERAKDFFALVGDDLTPAAWNARIHADDYPGYRAPSPIISRGARRVSSTSTGSSAH
jgi:PAS domain-containing protein